MSTPKERPILFSDEMMRALIEGRKVQTRRVVKPQPQPGECIEWLTNIVGRPPSFAVTRPMTSNVRELSCPYGAPGDRLWVREAWASLGSASQHDPRLVRYRADTDGERVRVDAPWRPSIHMPRWASRITLEITAVRVERLQALKTWTEATEADVLAEGLTFIEDMPGNFLPKQYGLPGRMTSRSPWCAFQKLWDEINGDRAPWASNPWVWVISFKRVEGAAPGSEGGPA